MTIVFPGFENDGVQPILVEFNNVQDKEINHSLARLPLVQIFVLNSDTGKYDRCDTCDVIVTSTTIKIEFDDGSHDGYIEYL